MGWGYANTLELLDDHLGWLREWTSSGELDQIESSQCTVFTFTRTPNTDRYSMRIGGLPAWSTLKSWPECSECQEPMAFVAQFDFRNDSSVNFDNLIFHYCFGCSPWESGGASSVTLSTIPVGQQLLPSLLFLSK